jgi:hypothetical protein
LQFNAFFTDSYHFGTKLYPDGNLMFLSKAVIDELKEKAGFTNT